MALAILTMFDHLECFFLLAKDDKSLPGASYPFLTANMKNLASLKKLAIFKLLSLVANLRSMGIFAFHVLD